MGKYNPVDAAVVAELKQIAGDRNVWLDREKMEDYSHDAVTGEKYAHFPEAVVFPETTEQVAETAARQPVGAKALLFNNQQGRKIIQGG